MDLVPTNEQDEGKPTDWSLVEIETIRNDPKLLEEILQQPWQKIAVLVTGAISTDMRGWATAGGRLVQGALRGTFLKQFARELLTLIAAGAIPEDYAEKKFGFQTLAELLRFIDEEEVDEDRLFAVQAMFLAVNAIDTKEGERILHYELFKISKKLSSTDLLLLKVTFGLYNESKDPENPVVLPDSISGWNIEMGRRLGHNVSSLVEVAAENLENEKLLSGRRYTDNSGIFSENARLTELGIHFCLNIQKFQKWRDSKHRGN